MSCICPHCGENLAEVGVVRLVGFLEYPSDDGTIPYESSKANRLDDTEGYRCAHCGEELNFDEDSEKTRIFGR